MPWWIWLILALAMLAVLIAGIIYVIIHGLHALQSVHLHRATRGGRQSIHAGPYEGGQTQAGTS